MSWETLAEAPLVRAVSESIAVFAAVESLHIVCIALLGGCVLIGGLAALGLRPPGIAARDLVNGLRRAYRAAIAGAALTGGLLFATAAQKYLSNPVFAAKFVLLVAALLAHEFLRRDLGRTARHAQALALASLSLWLATVTAGRWIGLI